MSSTVAHTVTRGWVRAALRHKKGAATLCPSSFQSVVEDGERISNAASGDDRRQFFSTETTTTTTKKKQDFVETNLDGGVAWKNRAVIMSAEDFENRPKVGFDEEFASMHDAMAVLSWLSDQDKQKIYDFYLEMMRTMADRHSNVTSHDYVIRVVAQKFNIAKDRAAAVIAQTHEEERMKANGETLHDDAQQYVDAKVQHHISAAYSTYNEVDPNTDPNVTFVEDPITANTRNDDSQLTIVDDLIDVEQIVSKAKLRLQEEAQIAISNRRYVEDVDPDQTPVDITRQKECHNLIHRKNNEFAHMAQPPSYYPSSEERQQQQRPRWKFVAKTINTRKDTQKKKNNRRGSSRNYKMANTLVEHNGTLRVATVKEASNTSFLKSKRDVTEFTLSDVKQAWIDRQLFGKVGGWGRAPEQPKKKVVAESKDTPKENNETSEDVNEKNES